MADRDAKIHNDNVGPLIARMWELAAANTSALNVLAESLLVGVAMLNFPDDARRQALLIQEIADGAADRAQAVQP